MYMMILIIIFLFLIFIIASIFYLINLMSSKKFFIDREKISPFECGFDPICSASMPFTIQFFLISLIFLIFDIEIVLLLPLIFFFKISLYNFMICLSMFFVNLLMLGLIFEWTENYINWID